MNSLLLLIFFLNHFFSFLCYFWFHALLSKNALKLLGVVTISTIASFCIDGIQKIWIKSPVIMYCLLLLPTQP